MAHVYVSMVIEAPVEKVWSVARDFTGNWHSSVIANSEIEGALPSDEVGCVRNFSLANGGGQLREQLVGLSDERHEFAYRILDSPLPVSGYHATARFTPITTSGQTFGEWWVDFRVPPEDEQGTVELVRGVFEAGLSDLARLTAAG